MKLYSFHTLSRHPGTHYTKFGYGVMAPVLLPDPNTGFIKEGIFEPVGRQQFLAGADWLEFGAAIMSAVDDTWTPPQIYKSVEYGQADAPNIGGVIVERYFFSGENNKLIPFRVRYRYTNGRMHDDVLYLGNIQKFHSDILGDGSCGPAFVDPVAMFSDMAISDNLFNPYPTPSHVWEAFYHFHWNGGPNIAHAAFRDTDITDHIVRALFSGDRRQEAAMLDVPNPPRADTLMRKHQVGAIPIGALTGRYGKSEALPLGVPDALSTEVEYGDILHTPQAFANTAAGLNDLLMTDLDVKYILLQGSLSEPEVFTALDRYAHLVPSLTDQRLMCNRIAETAWSELKTYLTKSPDTHGLLECKTLEIRIVKTYNDEALLTFRPSAGKKAGGLSVHIDLALLGLCAPGAAVTN